MCMCERVCVRVCVRPQTLSFQNSASGQEMVNKHRESKQLFLIIRCQQQRQEENTKPGRTVFCNLRSK